MTWDKDHWAYNCHDGKHDSFWKAVVESSQWEDWKKDVAARLHKANRQKGPFKNIWDIWECETCGWISPKHLQAFFEFVGRRHRWSQKNGSKKTGSR